jgi:hypothetical protein
MQRSGLVKIKNKNMNPETHPTPEKVFETLHQQILNSKDIFAIENIEGFSKVDFLKYLAQTGKFLFHGTNFTQIEELEPRLANCRSKNFGNLEAVYATMDPVLPVFHSVFNKKYFAGVHSSGTNSGNYVFKVDGKFEDDKIWTDGCVYILDRTKFEQGTDDDGKIIDEFASKEPVKPLAKLHLTPEDFPYLDEVEIVKK